MARTPFNRRHLLLAALVGGVLLLVVGRHFASAGAPSVGRATGRPRVPRFAIAAPPVVVDVVGAVRRPGLYRLTQGKRIADAVARAGGATRKADLAAINLAAPLADGEQVVVPARPAAGGDGGSTGSAPAVGTQPTGPVHLSTATLEQLDALPGVGPVTAQKILDYRTAHGAFSSVEELDAISGIGPARLDQLRDLVAP